MIRRKRLFSADLLQTLFVVVLGHTAGLAGAAQLTLSIGSHAWRPASEPVLTFTLAVASDTAQDVLADRLTSWQLGLRWVPQAGAVGTLEFKPPSLPAGYLLAGRNVGLFQGGSPADQLLVTDATSQGNNNAVQVPAIPTPLLGFGVVQHGAHGVFALVAQRSVSLWTGRESLDPAERAFANFEPAGDATLATLTVLPLLSADANGDCSVGAADYAIWAAQFGQTTGDLSADFDGNGTVGAGDYALWAANFGNTCPPSGTNVPEPSALALCVMGVAFAAVATCVGR